MNEIKRIETDPALGYKIPPYQYRNANFLLYNYFLFLIWEIKIWFYDPKKPKQWKIYIHLLIKWDYYYVINKMILKINDYLVCVGWFVQFKTTVMADIGRAAETSK